MCASDHHRCSNPNVHHASPVHHDAHQHMFDQGSVRILAHQMDEEHHHTGEEKPAYKAGWFVFDDRRYRYRRWGDAARIPILLLHGFMQSGDGWWTVASALAQDHCVYALDLIGHGQSDPADEVEAYSLLSEAAMVQAFIEDHIEPVSASCHEGKAQRVHLLGYSLGGRIALELAYRQPRLLYSLILESVRMGPVDGAARTRLAQRNESWAHMILNEGLERFVDQWEALPLFASQQRLNPSLKAAVRAERMSGDPGSYARVLEFMGAHTMRDEAEAFAMLAATWIPILYVCGTQDEASMRLGEHFIHEGFEACAIMAGHNIHLEMPEGYLDALRGFFSTVELRGC